MHLAEDARFRVAMTQAYLAMVRDETVGDDVQALALQNVFRHPTIGLLGDEAPAVSLTEIVQKLAGKK